MNEIGFRFFEFRPGVIGGSAQLVSLRFAYQCFGRLLSGDDGAFHEALPIGEVFSGEEYFAVWALQQWAESEPLPGAIEGIGAVRVAIALPGVRSYRAAELTRARSSGIRSRVIMSMRRRSFCAARTSAFSPMA